MDNAQNCYDVPQYWDLAFSEDTQLEADFIEAAAARYCNFPLKRILEPGCGGGRLVLELARRGYDVTGWDLSASAVDWANQRLQNEGLGGRSIVADMTSHCDETQYDLAHCLVNTFRHLLTEDDAVGHLRNIASSLRPGGLYIIGMHLLPPDADEEDDEEWSVAEDGVTVHMRLDVADCDRELRLETLRFRMTVSGTETQQDQVYQTDYRMRLYEAEQLLSLLKKVPEFQLVNVFDFWYDIEESFALTDEMGDTVLVLQKQP